MESLKETIDRMKKLKDLPKQAPSFKEGQIVNSPIGEMMVVDGSYGHEVIKEIWVPNVRLAFLKKDNTINKLKNHRFFTQDRLSLK